MSLGKYVCLEGVDGLGKSTMTNMLYDRLKDKGCIKTSEPGDPESPLTMQLRSLALDAKWKDMTPLAREYIFQAARSINLQNILPHILAGKLVISDRGILSGFAYGQANGLEISELWRLFEFTTESYCEQLHRENVKIYDLIVILEGTLGTVTDKKEFVQGDVMEIKGSPFIDKVRHHFKEAAKYHLECPKVFIDVTGKTRDEVYDEIIKAFIAHKIL